MIIGTISTGLSHSSLSSIRRSRYLSLFSCSFCSALESQSAATSMSDTLLFILTSQVWSMCWYHSVCSDTIVPEQLCIFILGHWLWLMFIPLITARHLVCLAQIPVHRSSHCHVSSYTGSVLMLGIHWRYD